MHVLIISNSDTDLAWVNNPLTATGLIVNVVNACSIKDATALMSSVKFDMVLYDLAFSENGMADHVRQLSGISHKVPLIVLTDNIGDPAAKEALKNGANYHMVKDRLQLSAMVESFKSILVKHNINYN